MEGLNSKNTEEIRPIENDLTVNKFDQRLTPSDSFYEPKLLSTNYTMSPKLRKIINRTGMLRGSHQVLTKSLQEPVLTKKSRKIAEFPVSSISNVSRALQVLKRRTRNRSSRPYSSSYTT